jgi:CheY-like chemotaxis protein
VIGHYWGYRHWSTPDASTNVVPLGLLIGGEELHNNHHAYPTSAKLSMKWYEFDIGWLYIRLLAAAKLAKVKHTAPVPHLVAAKPAVDLQTLQAIVACRYAVLAQYGRSLRRAYREEDDDEVRAATRKLLSGLGYRVVEAADAVTALSLLKKEPALHLLLTDVVLAQGTGGPELAREARRLRPDLKVLFMSGYVRDTAAFHEQLEQDAHFLAKPFSKEDLARKLRLALGSGEG